MQAYATFQEWTAEYNDFFKLFFFFGKQTYRCSKFETYWLIETFCNF